ncbi:MAG TPA: type VII secretion integral membrane protein EccD [Asanoa sp.]
MTTGLARVTISAPQRRLDVALPEHVPLAELLPEVLRHAGEGLADDGERHGGWLLRRTDGATLAGGQGLGEQGIRDGEVLHLVPAWAPWPELEYDDVVETIAEGARRRGAGWSGPDTRVASLVTAGLVLGVGLVAALHAGSTANPAMLSVLGVAAVLTLAGILASRAYGDGRAGAALAGFALPYAFLAGAMLVSSGDPAGPVPGLRWMGAPELMVASAALTLHGVLGLVGVGAGRRVFAAAVTAGLLGTLSALLALVLPTGGAAAVVSAALVCGVGMLPLLAIRLGRLPVPPVTVATGTEAAEGFTRSPAGPSSDTARSRPERGVVFAAVARTEELLTGMLVGHAAAAIVAALVLVLEGGLAGRVLAGVAAAALALRARLFVSVRQRVPLLTAGLASATVLVTALVVGFGRGAGLAPAFVGGGLLVGLGIVVAGSTYAERPAGPYLGRAADLFDTLLLVSVVPIACAVLGLYEVARGLLS